jgi:hypothetical protein
MDCSFQPLALSFRRCGWVFSWAECSWPFLPAHGLPPTPILAAGRESPQQRPNTMRRPAPSGVGLVSCLSPRLPGCAPGSAKAALPGSNASKIHLYGRNGRAATAVVQAVPPVAGSPSGYSVPDGRFQAGRKLEVCPSMPGTGRTLLDERSQPELMTATVANRKGSREAKLKEADTKPSAAGTRIGSDAGCGRRAGWKL